MAFTVQEFHDLIQLLEQHPEWRTELRRLVLSEELLSLPQAIRELTEAQRRTEEQVGQLAGRLEALTQRVDSLTQHMDSLTQRVDQLATRMDSLTQHTDTLTQRVDQLAARMDQLVDVQLRMGNDLEQLKGSDLERRYRERGHAYFSRLVRRAHVLSGDELNTLLDTAVIQSLLSEDEADEILQADMVVRGRRRQDNADVFLVVEVSWGVGLSDVQRAAARADLLTRTGHTALPVVAGFWVTPEAQELSQASHVWQVTNGRVVAPDSTD